MTSERGPVANRLLASLAAPEYNMLQPHLRLLHLEVGQTVADQDEPIRQLHFPISAAISMLTVLRSGDVHEHVIIGNDGAVGFPALLGDGRSPFRAIVQVAGDALVLPLTSPLAPVQATGLPGLRSLAARYAITMLRLTGQAATCAASHLVEQRVARSLLRMQDLHGGGDIPTTHEFLALLLGVQRQTVTLAAGRLQRQGLIRYGRGRVTILDRGGLEAASCECYRAMVVAQERMFD